MDPRLAESIENSPIVVRNGYRYFVHPLTDGIPRMDPELLREAVDWIIGASNFDCDLIVAPESMGLPLAIPVSLKLGLPYSVIRKRVYGLPGEYVFQQKTGYSESVMSINGVGKGDRVVIIDDVISTGGTLEALTDALSEIGATVVDVLIPVGKSGVAEKFAKKTGIKVKTMVEVSPDGDRFVCKPC